MDPNDIRYILDDLACNASQEALQELYMLYYKRIARYIGLYVRYDGAVMELTSDVFFAVWENRLELPEIRNFNAYIYRIAKFKALNYLREINRAIESLPPKCKLAFKLVREDRMSHREAAETLYISVKTLEVHLGHAVQKIREALRKKNIC